MSEEEAYVAIAEELETLSSETYTLLSLCTYAYDQGLYPAVTTTTTSTITEGVSTIEEIETSTTTEEDITTSTSVAT